MKVKSLLIFIMSLCMCSMFSMYGLAEGEPSKPKTDKTYSIGTEQDFKKFISDLEAVKAETKDDEIEKVTLNNNIDISALSYCDLPFKATFDGNGKKILIKELKVDLKDVTSEGEINIGLLGKNEGTISNLAVEIEKVTVTNVGGNDINIGGICGYNQGTQKEQDGGKIAITSGIIDQCFCYIGEVKCTGLANLNIGGIAGISDGIVSNCYSEVYLKDIVEVSQPLAPQMQIDGTSLVAVGGIVGLQDNRVNKGSMVNKCYSLGKINLRNLSSINSSVGSICGYINTNENQDRSVAVQTGGISIPMENCMCLMNEVNGNSIFDTNFLVQDNKSLHIYDKCEYLGEVLAEKMAPSPSDLITYDDREFKLFIKGTNKDPFDMLKVETGASGVAGTAKTTELWKLTDLGRNSKYICHLPELISISEDAQDPYSYLMLNKVYVDGIEVTKRNCKDILDNKNKGKVAYDARKNTLSINGIDIEKGKEAVTEGIKAKSDLVINSSGTNKIHGYCYGIRSDEGALVLEGTGGLNLQCGNSDISSIGNSRGIYTEQDLTLSLDSKLSISDFENGIECGSDLINFKGVTEISNCKKGILINGKYENWQGSTMKINKATYGINQKDAGKKEEFAFEFKGGEVEVSSDSESMVASDAEGYDIKIVPPVDKQVKVSYGTDKSQLSGEPKYYKSTGTFNNIAVNSDAGAATGDAKSSYKYIHLEEKNLDTVDDGNNDNKDNDNKDNNNGSDDKDNNGNGDKNNGNKDNNKDSNKDNDNSSGDKTNNDNSSGSLDDDIFGGNSSTNGSIDNNLSGAGGTSATSISTGDISDLFLIYALCVSALGIVLISLKLRKNK